MTLGACFLKGRLPYEKKAPFKIPSVVVIFTVIYWPRLTTDVGSLELICPAKGDAIPYVTPFSDVLHISETRASGFAIVEALITLVRPPGVVTVEPFRLSPDDAHVTAAHLAKEVDSSG